MPGVAGDQLREQVARAEVIARIQPQQPPAKRLALLEVAETPCADHQPVQAAQKRAGEAESGAAVAAAGGVLAGEALEDMLAGVGGHAGAGVDDGEAALGAVVPDLDTDAAALRGVTDGVVEGAAVAGEVGRPPRA